MKLTIEERVAIIAPSYAEHAGISLEQAKKEVRKELERIEKEEADERAE